MIKVELVETAVYYCDGCSRKLGHETIYGYRSDHGEAVHLGSCCKQELREFEQYMLKVELAVDEIKHQPFFK